VTLWQKMAEAGGSTPAEFLSTHPAPGNRQAALESMIPAMRTLNPDGRMAPVTAVEIVR
jgi:predicted Zn-dependent protease